MKKLRFRNNSIMRKMMITTLLVMVVQAGLFCGAIMLGGTVEKLKQNAFDILNERVINRKNYIQNDMIARWSNLEESLETVNSKVSQVLQDGQASFEDISVNSALSTRILSALSEDIIYLLRKNSVTGAFVILNGQDDMRRPTDDGGVYKSGFYIRDLNPNTNSSDNTDILIERAPSAITKGLEISMDTKWQPQFVFTDANHGDYFYEPFLAAVENPEIDALDLGYWSHPFYLSDDYVEIITYSVPLINEEGVPYGVLGVELTTDYLRKQMPYDEISGEKEGSYLLAVGSSENMKFSTVISSGPIFKKLFGEQKTVNFSLTGNYGNSYEVEMDESSNETVYGCVQYFQLYNTNTPFEDDQWALIGIMESDSLLSFANKVERAILFALVFSLFIGVIGAYIASSTFTRPIASLVEKMRESGNRKTVKLDKINIAEIDELSSAIEQMSMSVADSASKLSQIIKIAGISIGAFESRNDGSGMVFYTDNLFELVGAEGPCDGDGYVSNKEFRERMNVLRDFVEESSEDGHVYTCRIPTESFTPRWISLKIVENASGVLGVASDITKETLEKRKIEHDRDYDLLTNILNRRAFHSILGKKLESPEEIKTAALVMLDLDNLKYINDTYGHDYGDDYIRHAAGVLKRLIPYRAVVARMSGDEFFVFIYGYDDKDELRKIINKMKEDFKNTLLPLPDNKVFRLRASAGVSWYPSDSTELEQLIRYADFAMYNVKNTLKGEFHEFDQESYNKNSYLLQSNEEFDRFIEEELVDYYFQPIVDVVTGEVFAYETLMRPRLDNLKTPIDVLTVARFQSKLYQVEQLTWFKSLEAFEGFQDICKDCKVFINSISNQLLSRDDMARFEKRYEKFLDRIVLEITEEERLNEDFTNVKREYIQKWRGEIALDDFGTGYNGDAILLFLTPNYVKIDMSIVRNINSDESRQKIFCNLVSYSRDQHIKVIAEGIETKAELETLIANGVDYVQGYYIGAPESVPQKVSSSLKAEILEARKRLTSK